MNYLLLLKLFSACYKLSLQVHSKGLKLGIYGGKQYHLLVFIMNLIHNLTHNAKESEYVKVEVEILLSVSPSQILGLSLVVGILVLLGTSILTQRHLLNGV